MKKTLFKPHFPSIARWKARGRLPIRHHMRLTDRHTDRQTDSQTDRIATAIPCLALHAVAR